MQFQNYWTAWGQPRMNAVKNDSRGNLGPFLTRELFFGGMFFGYPKNILSASESYRAEGECQGKGVASEISYYVESPENWHAVVECINKHILHRQRLHPSTGSRSAAACHAMPWRAAAAADGVLIRSRYLSKICLFMPCASACQFSCDST